MERRTFVILGAGLAGVTAAATLRDEGFDGRVVLVGDEPRLPYERPPLSKEYLRGERPLERIIVRPEPWFEEQDIDTRFGQSATSLDLNAHRVALASGEEIAFDRALLATGSRARRPDIPVLVVQSGQSGGSLNGIPGIDFGKYPQIMAAPPVPAPADYFALTRLLLVPSVWAEPFGRVAAEAMINGIPPIVGNRGALPQVVGGDFAEGGGGRVLPIPDWMTPQTTDVPSEHEIEPWYEAVCALWDDPNFYRSVATRARQIAEERYSEGVSRKQHVDYFTSLKPGGRPIQSSTPAD